MSQYKHNRLVDFVPRAGMAYPPLDYLLGRQRRDASIMAALEQTGFAEPRHHPNRETRTTVDQVLADTLMAATEPHAFAYLCGEGDDIIDFLSALRDATPWAMQVGESVFIQFCYCLVEARKAWKRDPRPPYEIGEHSNTAKVIDILLESVGSRWRDADFEIYGELAGAWYDDEDAGGGDKMMEDLEEEVRKGIENMDIGDMMDLD
ncbi:hypothetical protein GGR54DRAFT_639450 [Hypoxylon sp. NC1633]|nr:hypothetical protein GGR54DRAFT_639450 [Hypoxylon sp. NC1633]